MALLPRLSVHYVSPTMRTMIIFFFSCPFSEKIWGAIKNKLNVSWPDVPLNTLVNYTAQYVKGKNLGAIISRLSFTCTVYCIWLERNNRIFTRDKIPEEVVLNKIVNMIRFRVMSITSLKKHASDAWFLSTWKLPSLAPRGTPAN